MSELEERSTRLTPREWRVVALVIEGVPTSQACDSLGIASGTFESHKQAIRRKLGIPRGERLEKHLQIFAGKIPPEAPAKSARSVDELERETTTPSDRRVRLLFRMTVDELQEVAGNAELRASLLEQTIKRMSSDDVEDAQSEIDDLRKGATRIREAARKMLEEVRSRKP
ncbi:MAG: LuxR C-terminal-related transcriptional regulator [Actinomycetota bacterium]